MNKWKAAACAMTACMLLPALVYAEEVLQNDGMLTMNELNEWVEDYRERAMAADLLNDPREPQAFSEDGYALIYEFASIYADRPEMTEDTVINAVVLWSQEEEGPRGVHVDQEIQQAMTLFYNENERMDGTTEAALLYISDLMPEESGFGTLLRDGQRISVVQYSVFEPLPEIGTYTDAGLLLTVQDGVVSAVRVYGLNGVVTEAEAKAALNDVMPLADETGYCQVPAAENGVGMSAFGKEDLSFSGIDFKNIQPAQAEALFGPADCDEFQDENGDYYVNMEFPECVMTFIYDHQHQNPRLYSILIDVDSMEGPRGVRVGDTIQLVMNRFRNDNAFVGDGDQHPIYGTQDDACFAYAEYGSNASATLRYACAEEQVTLMMTFDQLLLREITLYRMD